MLASPMLADATTDVIGAVVGVIGAIVGVLGFLFGRRERRESAREREENRRARERAQAEKVSAWAEKRTDEGRLVVARNASDQLVRDVRLWLVRPGDSVGVGTVPDREPTARRAVLEPHDSLEYLVRTTRPAPAARPPVVMAFDDGEGRSWLRNADGQLTRRDA